MSKLYKFEVTTPTKKFYEDEVDFISFQSLDGEMGVMANHAPMVVVCKPGTLKIKKQDDEKKVFISEGFVEITSKKVSAVVDFAGWADELNTEKIIKDKQMAEEKLESTTLDKERQLELIASIERSKAAMKTAGIRG